MGSSLAMARAVHWPTCTCFWETGLEARSPQLVEVKKIINAWEKCFLERGLAFANRLWQSKWVKITIWRDDSFFFVQLRWKNSVSGNDIIWQRGMEKHLVETGHTRSVVSFCEECWKDALVSISHHCHVSCPSNMGFFKKSDNICERKISAGGLIAEVFLFILSLLDPKTYAFEHRSVDRESWSVHK